MKIIKQGNPVNGFTPIRFSCRYCGCIFEAESGEYQEYSTPQLNLDLVYYEGDIRYRSFCPTCGRPVFYQTPHPL